MEGLSGANEYIGLIILVAVVILLFAAGSFGNKLNWHGHLWQQMTKEDRNKQFCEVCGKIRQIRKYKCAHQYKTTFHKFEDKKREDFDSLLAVNVCIYCGHTVAKVLAKRYNTRIKVDEKENLVIIEDGNNHSSKSQKLK